MEDVLLLAEGTIVEDATPCLIATGKADNLSAPFAGSEFDGFHTTFGIRAHGGLPFISSFDARHYNMEDGFLYDGRGFGSKRIQSTTLLWQQRSDHHALPFTQYTACWLDRG